MRTETFEQQPSLTFDVQSAESPSNAVVNAVAAIDDAHPLELEPLYDAIDTDALDTVFRSRSESTIRSSGHVDFCYSGYLVRVGASGDGAVFEAE